jgi:excinuclease ABC subunit C
MIDTAGELFYVGKAKALQRRVLSYFFSREDDSKARRIGREARRLIWEPAPHELAALLRELELIRRWLPRSNVRDRPRNGGLGYICVGRGRAPFAYLATQAPRRERRVFGPLPLNRGLRRMVRRLNDCFQLRDCPARIPIVFEDEPELFPQDRRAACLRFDVGTCLAPCAAACSTRQYVDRVRAAVAFLRGSDASVVAQLEKRMRAASAERRFELAASLRDAWQDLSGLYDRLERIRDARGSFNFVYPLPGYGKRTSWYLIRRGQLVRTVDAPRMRREARKCLRLLDAIYDNEHPGAAAAEPENLNVLLLLCSWFRRHAEERQKTISIDDALKHCGATLKSAVAPR